MSDRERGICARLRTLREQIRWAQPEFAKQVGITRDQLASIEHGRTPLRYSIAWRVGFVFGISLRWLAGDGSSAPDEPEHDDLPLPGATGMPKNALLSEVDQKFSGPNKPTTVTIGAKIEPGSEGVTDLEHRAFYEHFLKLEVEDWIARLPSQVTAFSTQLCDFAEAFISSLPKVSHSIASRRRAELLWSRVRFRNANKFFVSAFGEKRLLTEPATSSRMLAVKLPSDLKSLRARLHKLLKSEGKMRDLAGFIPAPYTSVSRWVSGKREPGGKTTLRMLQWVEQQERQ